MKKISIIFTLLSVMALNAFTIAGGNIFNSKKITNIAEWRFDCDKVDGDVKFFYDYSSVRNNLVNKTWRDSESRSKNPGNVMGTNISGSNIMCSALDGYSNGVSASHNSAYNIDSGTISFWFNDHHIADANAPMFEKGQFLIVGVPTTSGSTDIQNKGKVRVSDGVHSIDSKNEYNAGGDLYKGVTDWVFVTVTFEKNSKMKLYLNGELEGESNYNNAFNNSQNIRAAMFSGAFDELYIFDGVMNSSQVKELFNQQLANKNLDGSSRDCGCTSKPSTPFVCTNDTSLLFSSFASADYTDAYFVDFVNKSIDKKKRISSEHGHLNAAGYNVVDNYIYAFSYKSQKIVKIDALYNIVDSFDVEGLPTGGEEYYLGDVATDSSNKYFIAQMEGYEPNRELEYIYEVDLSTKKARRLTLDYSADDTKIRMADFAFNPIDNMLYIVNSNDNSLYKLDVLHPTSGINNGHISMNEFVNVEKVGSLGLDGNVFGPITFFDGDGNMYFVVGNQDDSKNDIVYKITNAKDSSHAEKFSEVKVGSGDGARCALAKLPLKPREDGLVADYHFDECDWNGTKGEVLDSSGIYGNADALNKINTKTGGVIYRDTKFLDISKGKDGELYKTRDRMVKIDNNPDIKLNKNLTISLWVKFDQDGTERRKSCPDQTFIHKNAMKEFSFGINGSTLYFNFCERSEEAIEAHQIEPFKIYTNKLEDANVWHHLVVTRDMDYWPGEETNKGKREGKSRDPKIKFYIDGELLWHKHRDLHYSKDNFHFCPGDIGDSTDPIYIGNRESKKNLDSKGVGDYRPLFGDMDEVKIFTKTLSDEDIKSMYENEKSGYLNFDGSKRDPVVCVVGEGESKLVADYHFDECYWNNDDDAVKDSSDNMYDAKVIRENNTTANTDFNKNSYIVNRYGKFKDGAVKAKLALDSDSFSVSFWAKVNGASVNNEDFETFIYQAASTCNVGHNETFKIKYNYKYKTIVVHLSYKDKDVSPFGVETFVVPYNLEDGWHNIVMTYGKKNYGNKKYIIRIYADKELILEKEAKGELYKPDKRLYIGGDEINGNVYPLNGLMDEVRLYNGILMDKNITRHYDNQKLHLNYDGSSRKRPNCDGNNTTDSGICYAIDDTKGLLYTLTMRPGVIPASKAVKRELTKKDTFGEGGAYRAIDQMLYVFDYRYMYRVNPKSGLVELAKEFSEDEFPKRKVSGASFYFDVDKVKDWLYVTAVDVGDYDGDSKAVLYKIDPDDNWKVVSKIDLTGDSNSIKGSFADADALAISPKNGDAYVVIDNSGDDSIEKNYLYKLDLETGITTNTGISLPEKRDRESLSFADDGNLYIANSDEHKDKEDGVDDYVYMIDLDDKKTYISAQIPPNDNVDIEGLSCNSATTEVSIIPRLTIEDSNVTEGPEGKISTITFDIKSDKNISEIAGVEGALIKYELIGATATENVDFNKYRGSFFMSGDSYKLPLKVVKGDYDIEDDEVFIVKFTSDKVFFQRDEINATIIDDDFNISLNAFTTPYLSNDRVDGNITTQIVDKYFNLHIIAYNNIDGHKILVDDVNVTKIELVHNLDDLDPSNDQAQLLLDPKKMAPLYAPHGKVDFNTSVFKAYKDVKIRVTATYHGKEFIDYSVDNFAVRPDKFSFGDEITKVEKFIAGKESNITIYAYSADKKPAKLYNEIKDISFVIEANQTKTGCNYSPSDLTISLNAFANGELNGTTKYNNVGIIDINISEIKGSEFAKVDADDTPDEKDRLITPSSTTMKFVPSGFKVTADFNNPHNKKYAYYSDDLTNAPYLNVDVLAVDIGGNTLTNYDSSCLSKNMELNITVDTNASADDTIYLLRQQDGNESKKVKSEVAIEPVTSSNTSHYKYTIDKKDFKDGNASTKITLSLTKDIYKAKNPALESVSKVVAKDEDNVSTSLSLRDKKVQFQDMRIFVEDPVSVVGKKELNVSVYYETYYNRATANRNIIPIHNERSISGDNNWFRVDESEDRSTKMSFSDLKARYSDTKRSQPSKISNTTINVTTKNLPENNKITAKPEEEFMSGFRRLSTDVSFISVGKWTGKGKTGNTVDNNISKRQGFRKLNW